MGKAEGPECRSDWNFDYHGIILLKEIPWTKSTGMLTDERASIHGFTVDRASYPFGVLIWGTPFGFNGWKEGGPGQRLLWAVRLGYTAAGSPEVHRNGALVVGDLP
jgi:hypothetical protein